MTGQLNLEASSSPSCPAVIRLARGADLPAVIELMRRVQSEVYAPNYPKITQGLPNLDAASIVSPDVETNISVAEADGRIVGVVWSNGSRIFDLYVDKAMRSRGVGVALLEAAERRLCHQGVRWARLDAARDYHEVVAFYERLGWCPGRKHRHAGSDAPLVEMTKELQPWRRALGRSCLWHGPKLVLLCCAIASVFLCTVVISILAGDQTNLGRLILGVMSFLVTWKVLAWDSGALQGWGRFSRALGVMASEVLSMALGAALCVVLFFGAFFGEGRTMTDVVAAIAVSYVVIASWSRLAATSITWAFRRWKSR